jgi:hypothetical protein
LFFLGLIVACIAAVALIPSGHSLSSADAAGNVQAAENALSSAFSQVLDTEKSGANVSGLIGRLNEAGSIFTEAEAALDIGNDTGATALANSCKTMADGIESDALTLKNNVVASEAPFWSPLLLGCVGAGIFLAVLYGVWRLFRNYYINKLVSGRVEVSA